MITLKKVKKNLEKRYRFSAYCLKSLVPGSKLSITQTFYISGIKRPAEGEASGAPAAKTAAVQGSNGLNNGPVTAAAPAVTPTVPRQLIAVSQGQVINKPD